MQRIGDFEFMGFHLFHPLHLSIPSQDTSQCLKLLLDAGADVNKPDNNGFTAVHSTTFSTNVECLKYLIEAGANVRIGKKSPLSVIQLVMMQILKTEVPPPIPPPIHHIPHPKERKQFSRDTLNCLRLLFAAGACVNKITWITSPEKLKVYQRSKRESFVSITSPEWKKPSLFRDHFMLMYAAGEMQGIMPAPVMDQEERFSLKHTCRETVRSHLIDVHLHLNLFGRVPILHAPRNLHSYLLNDMSLEVNETNKEQSQNEVCHRKDLTGAIIIPWVGANEGDQDDDNDDDDNEPAEDAYKNVTKIFKQSMRFQ